MRIKILILCLFLTASLSFGQHVSISTNLSGITSDGDSLYLGLPISGDLIIHGNVRVPQTNSYWNFGSTWGSSGYGLRDNNGTIQVKNSGGGWGDIQANWTRSGGEVSPATTTDNIVVTDTLEVRSEVQSFPLGNCLSLNGTSQYAYSNNSDEVNFEYDDFMETIWFKSDGTTNQGLIIKRESSSTSYFDFYVRSSNPYIQFLFNDGTGGITIVSSYNTSLLDGKWHNACVIIDRSDYGYVFVDGIFIAAADISSKTGSITNTHKLYVGAMQNGSLLFNGDIDDGHILRFGKDGLYVTNGGGGGSTIIKVGDSNGDTIWDQANGISLIPLIYKSPYASLSDLGYGSLEDADRTECLNETDFASHAKWDVTGEVDDTGGNAAFVFAGGSLNGTLTQTAANRANVGDNSSWYAFTYTVVVTTVPDGDFALTITNTFAESAVTLDFTAGTHTVVFKSASGVSTADFVIDATETTATQGDFTIDDVTLKRIGEVAYWKMNESGTPATLTDETSNSLDLTTSGSPSMVQNDYDYLEVNRLFADVELSADSTRFWCNLMPADSFYNVGSTSLPWKDMYADAYNTTGEDYAEMWRISPNALTEIKKEIVLPKSAVWNFNNRNFFILDTNTVIQKGEVEKRLTDLYNLKWSEGHSKLEFRIKDKFKKFVGDTVVFVRQQANIKQGTVVMWDLSTVDPLDVIRCTKQGFAGWWGIVSDNAGILGGGGIKNGVPVTAVGRIRAFVKGEVDAGDYLQTSAYGSLEKSLSETNVIAMQAVPAGLTQRVLVWVGK